MAVLSLPAIQNTFISRLYPKRCYGKSPVLFIGKSPVHNSICRCLLKFDIKSIPSSARINSSFLKLYLYRNAAPTTKKIASLHNLLAPFNENRVNYSNQPDFQQTPSAVISISDQLNTFIYWDITELVTDWHKRKVSDYGLVLTGLESCYSLVGFLSNYSMDCLLHPALLVDYSPDANIIQYPPEVVTSSDTWSFTKSLPLGGGVGTFGIQNKCTCNSAYVKLQISPDGVNWIDDFPTYMSITEFAPGDNAVLTTSGHMAYVRAAYKSVKSGEPSKLTIYVSIKKAFY
ncbi:DNRLRE domain-containing protein [Clostridium thermarum]|uniref:DNRLRE domain-containing protein n=1 Tax=Clostridium thermarum TaxID=1716543 RepID=UPI001122DBC6|nr:DNRLRE domain-containing protein [Clostridium thermarum]